MLSAIFKRNRQERPGFELYGAAVAAARDPFFYSQLAVPDTLDGRFDLIGLYNFLLIHRLRPDAATLAQAVFDAMFSDMDLNLREMGVGDLGVSKRVRAMWEAFHGRAKVYEAALAEPDPALAIALERNVWRIGTPSAGGTQAARALARAARAQAAHLAGQDTRTLLAGAVTFLPAQVAAR